MNKGTYGFGLPPNFATRVAPPKWNNFQPYTAPGTYSFTVPQNVYQVYGVAVGGGGDGSSVYTTVTTSTNMVFPVVQAHNFKGMLVSTPASNQFDTQLCAFGSNLYYFGSDGIYSTPNLGTATSTAVVSGLAGNGGYIFAKDGLMVAVFKAGATPIRWSTNGTNWTTSSNLFDASANNYAWGATNANLVITSSNNTAIQYSTNSAASFTQVATSGITTTIKGIAYGAGVFVAVGFSGGGANQGISSSPTGAVWTARTSVIATGQYFTCVRFLNNQFIAVAIDGTINTSPDGITWTNRTSGTSNQLHDITYDSVIGLYLISSVNGSSNQYLTSPDGITWTVRSLGVTLVGNLASALYCNSLNGCFVVNTYNTNATPQPIAATSTDGINWRLAAEHLSSDTSYTYTNPLITGGKMYFVNTSYPGGVYVGCNYTMPGGGGGGFASGIVDVVPGQTLTVTVGATAGSSSIGTNITATGGSSSGVAGTGVATPTLRGSVTASGGAGGVGTITDSTFSSVAWKTGSGGGGAAGWNGVAGGSGGSSSAITGSGGGGGILLGNGGSSTAAGAGGGGGAGFAGASTSATSSFGGGGTNSAGSGIVGGNGFSCSGGATVGLNGGNPTTTVSLSYVLSLLSGAFEGAGGAGGGSTTAGGNGSGIGGGGGGAGTSTLASGTGAIGGGGGGSIAGIDIGAGNSVFLGGGGGKGAAAGTTTGLYGWGGGSGAGGGGGAHNASMRSPPTSTTMSPLGGAAVGANVPGSKVNGAAGAGGVGYVALLWTEGY